MIDHDKPLLPHTAVLHFRKITTVSHFKLVFGGDTLYLFCTAAMLLQEWLFKEIVERLLSLQSRIDNFELFQPGRELLMEGELGRLS